MSNAVELVLSRTAEQFLERLNPRDPSWLSENAEWVFRGQGNSEWPLVPAANRGSAFDRLTLTTTLLSKRPGDLAKRIPLDPTAERRVLARFFQALDTAGLPIPGDGSALRTLVESDFANMEPWNTQECWPLVALAQHVGITTRLLDWTKRPRIAAYFAAKDAAEKSEHGGCLDVWALRADFVKRWCHQNPVGGLTLRIATAPRATNPNLHAQAGLFTVLVGDDVKPLDQYLEDFLRLGPSRAAWGAEDKLPLLRRLSLPQQESRKLLRLLAYEGITNGALFPGIAGVVEGMREQMLWDEPPYEVHV